MSTVSSITGTKLWDEINGLSPGEEWPVRGFLKRKRIGSEELFTMEFTLDQFRHQLPSPASSDKSWRTSTDMKTRTTGAQFKTLRRTRFTEEEDELLIDLKENRNFTWEQIKCCFPGRTTGTLQVHYCTKLKSLRSDDADEASKDFEKGRQSARCQRTIAPSGSSGRVYT
ncbi:MAG: hypothetical protein M1816_004807 [Peltula sp. TS41687]|nr:MAG: hypothetical protein M1816_004807 [Peltula sp. TS41687]